MHQLHDLVTRRSTRVSRPSIFWLSISAILLLFTPLASVLQLLSHNSTQKQENLYFMFNILTRDEETRKKIGFSVSPSYIYILYICYQGSRNNYFLVDHCDHLPLRVPHCLLNLNSGREIIFVGQGLLDSRRFLQILYHTSSSSFLQRNTAATVIVIVRRGFVIVDACTGNLIPPTFLVLVINCIGSNIPPNSDDDDEDGVLIIVIRYARLRPRHRSHLEFMVASTIVVIPSPRPSSW